MKYFVTVGLVFALLACTESVEPDLQADQVAASVRVVVTRPQQQSIDKVITALGSVESIHHPTISAEVSGQIIAVEVREGDSVQAQQLMATIDNVLHTIAAEKAAAELQRQEVLLDNQQREVNRLLQLAKTQSVSRDRLEDEQAQLAMLAALRDVATKQREQALYLESRTRILAPQSGLIAKRHISPGDYVTPGTSLFELVTIDTLRARIAFPEHQAAEISVGKEVSLMTPAAPASVATGTVTSINPQINPHSRAVEVIVEFVNPGGWYPGASVDASLLVERIERALLVPAISVVKRGGGDVVFVVDGDHARLQVVTLGWREDGLVEIVEGLMAEDQVVTEGSALVGDGSRLSLSMEKSAP